MEDASSANEIDSFWESNESFQTMIHGLLGKPLDPAEWRLLVLGTMGIHEFFPSDLPDENVHLAESFVLSANDDLRAAEVLYQYSLPALTVYHLQQAAEKVTKALCLLMGRTRLAKSHRSPQPILNLLGRFLRIYGKTLQVLMDTEFSKNLADANRLVNNEHHSLVGVPFSSSDKELGITNLLSIFDLFSKDEPLMREIEESIAVAVSLYQPLFPGIAELKPAIAHGLNLGRAAVMCYILGALTFAHETPTRYPGGQLEPKDYTAELGIVQAIPELLKRSPLMIASVEKVLECVSVSNQRLDSIDSQ